MEIGLSWVGGGGEGKKLPTSFSHVTSTNVGISPLNFPTLNSFATVVWNFKAIPSANPNLLNLDQGHPSKK